MQRVEISREHLVDLLRRRPLLDRSAAGRGVEPGEWLDLVGPLGEAPGQQSSAASPEAAAGGRERT